MIVLPKGTIKSYIFKNWFQPSPYFPSGLQQGRAEDGWENLGALKGTCDKSCTSLLTRPPGKRLFIKYKDVFYCKGQEISKYFFLETPLPQKRLKFLASKMV